MSNNKLIVQVALSSPFRREFDYIAPNNTELPAIGARVAVPFGHQKSLVGIVISKNPATSPIEKLKEIHQVLDEEALFSLELLSLCSWCADYYHFPLGDILHLALPAKLRTPEPIKEVKKSIWRLTARGKNINPSELKRAPKQQAAIQVFMSEISLNNAQLAHYDIKTSTIKSLTEKQLIAKEYIESKTLVTSNKKTTAFSTRELLKEAPLSVNKEQQLALDTINFQKFDPILLEGITGSGKTEVYLQAIEKVLLNDQQALVLVPEIGLTPQTIKRFEKRFNLPIASLHSGLSDRQRLEVWQQAKNGEINILIGTRSSIFSPLPNIGLIIVDEEHDLSYKQQEGVRYSARDIAIIRAQKLNIPLILGSATPSLESLQNALSGRYKHLHLTQRAQVQTLPDLECIESSDSDISEYGVNKIKRALEQKLQVLIFINRRGYAPTLLCKDCGWISQCQYCDNRMTLHRKGNINQLHCHSCDRKHQSPRQCPNCNSLRLAPLGSGTQRTEETLEAIFTTTPIYRIDRDNMSRKGQLEATLDKINTGEPCILVGTQMLAKGHHFPNLGLGLILGLDSAFFSSDFRGAERMGQILTQVAGRVGREKTKSKVLLQTQFKDHPLLKILLEKGYNNFAQQLLSERSISNMPPFSHLALIRCHAQTPQLAETFLQQARQLAQQIIAPHNNLQYLGPFPATIEKRNNRYHFLLQIKASNRKERQYLLKTLCQQLEKTKQVKGLHWLIDVDAQEF